jgi:hypothetical protein
MSFIEAFKDGEAADAGKERQEQKESPEKKEAKKEAPKTSDKWRERIGGDIKAHDEKLTALAERRDNVQTRVNDLQARLNAENTTVNAAKDATVVGLFTPDAKAPKAEQKVEETKVEESRKETVSRESVEKTEQVKRLG